MNKILLTFIALLLTFSATAQNDKKDKEDKEDKEKEPELLLMETEYNFGDIQQGETVEHVFLIENSGTKPLFISDVTTTCDCIQAESPQKPVTKGKTAAIRITFDSSGKIGPQNKVIIIESNALNDEAMIILRGNVLANQNEQ